MGFHPDSTSRISPLRRALAALSPRRRRKSASVYRAAHEVIESLEARQLLAVVNAGETALYYDGTNSFRIRVTGTSGSFTFTAAIRPDMGGGVSLGEVPMTVTGPNGTRQYAGGYQIAAPAGGGTLPSFDIYSVLGVDTSASTSLSITAYTPRNGNVPAFSSPFTAGTSIVNTFMTDPGQPAVVPLTLANGSVFIGGRQRDGTDAIADDVLSLTYNGGIAHSDDITLKVGSNQHPGIYVVGLNNKPASMDNLFIAGTITGRVSVTGSVNTFYAGNVLTGDVRDTVSNDIGSNNFVIGGDLRNLVVAGGIGTVSGAPDAFRSNAQITVGGRVQQISAGLEFRGAIDVTGATGSYTDGSDLTEIESRARSNANPQTIGSFFDSFQLTNQAFANNDTFQTPEILGSFKSDTTGKKNQVRVNGAINNFGNVGDVNDYYGISLLAGQSVVVQLQSTSALALASVQVFDPDGRLIAQDASNQNNAAFFNKPFTVKATQPGLYRVKVIPVDPTLLVDTNRTYTLSVTNYGALGLGGLSVTGAGATAGTTAGTGAGTIYFDNPTVGLRVHNNDLGAILAAGNLYGANGITAATGRDTGVTDAITADTANIRSVEADSISLLRDGLYGLFPNIVAAGSIGLIRANGVGSEPFAGYLYINNVPDNVDGTPSSALTIGGDYQVIQAAGDFSADLSTDRSIGVIRANTVSALIQDFPGFFRANADDTGNDGIIGLIDCNGNFGTFNNGGPALDAGVGGNVRYLNIGGTAYRDINSGTGQVLFTERSGATATFTDDSGATVLITPITGDAVTGIDTTNGSGGTDTTIGTGGTGGDPIGTGGGDGNPIGSNPNEPDPIGGTGTTTTTTTTTTKKKKTVATSPGGRQVGGTLTIGAYPSRSGGVVLFNVQSTTGVEIDTSGTGPNAAADIGKILTGSGTQAILNTIDTSNSVNASEQTALKLGNGQPLEVVARGVRTNIYSISGGAANLETEANYSRITNSTDGEIINLLAGDVGSISAEFIGVGRTVASTALTGLTNVTDPSITGLATVYPFNQAKTMIRAKNVADIDAREALGNIAVSGVVQNVVANSDGKNVKGTNEGIVAPVLASGAIRRVDVGEGLATSGSGETSFGGIYSRGAIGPVTNVNGGGDVRGDIIAGTFLEGVTLTGGGSIVDADILQNGGILTDANGNTSSQFEAGLETITFTIDTAGQSGVAGIGNITIAGTGGIINANVTGQNIGKTTVSSNGFGIVNSSFTAGGAGTMGGISAGGLGIRNSTYTGGGSIGDIVATGGGQLLDLDSFSTSVRASETNSFDASTGIAPNTANDLLLFFQTSKDDSSIVGETNSGIIADTSIQAAQSIGKVQAFDFRTLSPETTTPGDQNFSNQITIGNKIGSILAKRNINGLRVVTGSIGTIQAGGSISNFLLQTTNSVGSVNAKKSILGTARFNVTGDGSIGSFGVGGNMNGTIFAAQGIASLIVDGDLRSSRDQGGIYSLKDIGVLKISGDVLDGSYLRAKKSIKSLTINGDFQSGAIIRATKFSKTVIRGSNSGTLQVG